ncbi:hypothetical protein [Nonomuraea longicatena]|uniref:AsnC family protein n=1 Tax=Nonomuraea longicatena TaxID=83682 RepID=A0ABP3ZRX0_9ACTN
MPTSPATKGSRRRCCPTGSTGAFTKDYIGYQGACSCGWADGRRHPPTPAGAKDAEERWYRHAGPLLQAAAPSWLVVKSNLLCEQIVKLAGDRPLAALTLLSQVESWQRTLLDQAVAAARAGGSSWSEIGQAMGITKQAAHERFRS